MIPARERLIEAQFGDLLDVSPIEFSLGVKMMVKVVVHNATAPTSTTTGIVADHNFQLAAPLCVLINAHDQAAVSVVGGDINVSNGDIPAAVV